MKGKYLITTDNWFYAPDGKTYKAVFGEVEIVEDTFLGIKTNYRSSNWFAKVGTEENHVIIAGCQIHYSVKCEKVNNEQIGDYAVSGATYAEFERPTQIYIAE
jgi:hypothetical protein